MTVSRLRTELTDAELVHFGKSNAACKANAKVESSYC